MYQCHFCGVSFEKFWGFNKVVCFECVVGRIQWNQDHDLGQYVYKLIDRRVKGNYVVYIGVTNDPTRRFCEHLESKEFECMEVIQSFERRDDAEAYEKHMISCYRPRLNKSGVDRPFGDTINYLIKGEATVWKRTMMAI
ncbi:GIY-YIG nuclease family protein [Streptomyces halstedii]|uniref:GIY-YIG nuclease family protein n=1 Tax=Streptomyces halstedii TaxID=1944 RepID=UPI0037D3D72C